MAVTGKTGFAAPKCKICDQFGHLSYNVLTVGFCVGALVIGNLFVSVLIVSVTHWGVKEVEVLVRASTAVKAAT
jgi:hypothetical protein